MARRPISVEGTSASPRLRMWLDVVQRRLDLVERHRALVQRLQQPGAQLLAIEVLAAAVALHDDDAGALRSLVRRETVLHASHSRRRRMVLPPSRSRESMTRVPVASHRGQRMTSAELLVMIYTSGGTVSNDTTTYWAIERPARDQPGFLRSRARRLPSCIAWTRPPGSRRLLDQRCAQRLWGRQVLGPWVAITEVTQGGGW